MSGQDLNNTVFSFFGVPGSGKGTLADQCEEKLGFKVLSTGNLCRQHISDKTEIGKRVEEVINAGHLVPDELITKMVQAWIDEKLLLKKPIILDGYPRTAAQHKLFKELRDRVGYSFVFRVVFFDISDDEVMTRLVNRIVCSNQSCQAIYSLISSPPREEGLCDECGSKLVTREDDREEVIRERLKVFNDHKQEIIHYCESIDLRVEHLNVGAGLSIELVFENFKQML